MRHQTTSPQLKSCATTAASCCSAGAAPLDKVVKQRDFVGPIVIGGIVVMIASVLFMGWYSQGLTPEQIELLKAKRDAMALPVAEPTHKKKKWAQ